MRKLLLLLSLMTITAQANAAAEVCVLRTTGRYIAANNKLGTVIKRTTNEYFNFDKDICVAVGNNAYYSRPMINDLCSSYGAIAVVYEVIFKHADSSSSNIKSVRINCPVVTPPEGGEYGGGGM